MSDFTDPRCTFMVNPSIDMTCRRDAPWEVRYRVGTAHVLVDEPLRRCHEHLSPTIETLAPGSYETGWIDTIVRVFGGDTDRAGGRG